MSRLGRSSAKVSGSPRARRAGGFTLVELLVVLAVFAILASMVYSIAESFMTDTRRMEETDAVFGETRAVYQGLAELFRTNALSVADEMTSQCVWRSDLCAFPVISPRGEGVRIRQIAGSASELGASPRDYPNEIRFQYADSFVGGVTPEWKDRHEGATRPKLVKATVIVRSKKYPAINMTVTGVFDF